MAPPQLAARDKSSSSLMKPKNIIRVVHEFAPEVIHTDADNFREIVQRLTGKPPVKTTSDQQFPAARWRKKQRRQLDDEDDSRDDELAAMSWTTGDSSLVPLPGYWPGHEESPDYETRRRGKGGALRLKKEREEEEPVQIDGFLQSLDDVTYHDLVWRY